MAGHGYLAFGMISILPAMVLVAYVAQNPRFRPGISRQALAMCWVCMLFAFTFPLTCGFVGRHKRQQSVFDAVGMMIREDLAGAWDWGWMSVQLHLACIFLSFLGWRRLEPAPAQPGKRSSRSRDFGERKDLYRAAATYKESAQLAAKRAYD